MQFRNAVKTIMGADNCGKGWTDKPQNNHKSKRRYVKVTCTGRTYEKIKEIEFILWAQGVDAEVREGQYGLRGTCVMENK